MLHRWTRHQYERLIDHGFLDEDDRIQLLGGLLLRKEPQHSAHRTAVILVAKAVEQAFGEGWFVQTQSPIAACGRSEPEPDVCVVHEVVSGFVLPPGSAHAATDRNLDAVLPGERRGGHRRACEEYDQNREQP